MKKSILTRTVLSLLMTFATMSVFSSCSDDDPVTPDEEIPQDIPDNPEKPHDGIPGISDEYMKKISAIYDAATTGPQQISTINQLSIITSICSSMDGCGPISVTPATLNGEKVTLVTLGGMQNVEGQATSMEESQLASFGKPNDYLKAVINLFKNGTVPENRPVIISGISLGGMIAQQIIGVEEITKNHNISAIITFGSPITLPLNRKDIRVIRFTDISDGVPRMGESLLRNGMVPVEEMTTEEIIKRIKELDDKERISRSGKYTDWIVAHALSYIEDECWDDIDFLGNKPGADTLILEDDMKFYKAPKAEKKQIN